MDSPTTPPAPQVAAKIKKNARNKDYYARNRDAIRARRAEAYDPDLERQKYLENRELILAQQRAAYESRREAAKAERIANICGLCPTISISDAISAFSPELSMRDLEVIERMVLTVRAAGEKS